MSKYIIDLRPDCKVVQQICVSDDNVGIGARSVELFNALTDDYVKENFKDLLEGEYQRGLEEGKAQAERGCKGCEYEGKTGEHLPCDYCMNNFKNQWTAKDDKIEVGDWVNIKNTDEELGIVTKEHGNQFYILWADGSSGLWSSKGVVKTGRHFDIKSILEDMRHD